MSAFAYERHFSTDRVGYLTLAPDVAPYVSAFITDNHAVIDETISIYGIDRTKFFHLKYPSSINPRYRWSGRSRKILWASRFELEKRIDILFEIVKRMKDVEFDIFGAPSRDSSELTKHYWSALDTSVNVQLHGIYDGFEAIPADDYAAFLYTTEGDGLPNVLLEAQASGLACLAPRVGGISEIVSDEFGFLIEDFKDADAYVDQIERVFAAPRLVHDEIARALKNLAETRTQRCFTERLDRLPGYAAPPQDMWHSL